MNVAKLPVILAVAKLDTAVRDLVAVDPMRPVSAEGVTYFYACVYCHETEDGFVAKQKVRHSPLCVWLQARRLVGLEDEDGV